MWILDRPACSAGAGGGEAAALRAVLAPAEAAFALEAAEPAATGSIMPKRH